MSAKTPGLIAERDSVPSKNHRRQVPALPPLLVNIGPRASLVDYNDQNYESPLLFGPEGVMLLPTDPSNDVQPPQPVNQLQGLQASLSTVAASSSLVFRLQSLTSGVSSDIIFQPSITLLSSTTSAVLTEPPSQTPTSTPPPITSTQSSSISVLTSQSQSRSIPESQSQAGLVAASASSATPNGVTSATTTPPSPPSLTTSQSLSLPSSTSNLQRDFESLPRVAEIVIGIVGAISLIAFLSTLGSWIYKQRHRKNEQAEITSITSIDNNPDKGFFGCLKKRSGRHSDDMSELGFGLGHVTFFNEPNSGDEHHHAGLAPGAEHTMLEELIEGDRTKDPIPPLQNPFSDHFGVDMLDPASSTVRPLPVHLHQGGTVDGVSSISISPYQHLSSIKSLGGLSAKPLTVANFAQSDTSSDVAPSSVMRYPSVGTPRIGVSHPRFMSLVEEGALAVPWAPLNIRLKELQSIAENKESLRNDDEEARERDVGFEEIPLSRTSTPSLGLSRTFSQRLDHSLSKTLDWRNGITRPPPGTFRAAWDAQRSAEDDVNTNGTDRNWATTLKNNFYNALNAVGSSMHVTSTGNSNVDLEKPAQSTPDLTFVPYNGHFEPIKDPSGRVASVRLGRTKGSIIRGNLGIPRGGGVKHGTGLGLGLESLSRSSTLSTSWSETEKEPTEEKIRKVRMRVRGLSRESRLVWRSDTNSTASSMTLPASRHLSKSGLGRLGVSDTHMKPPSQRPRYSRVPLSQSSMWTATSFASTNTGKERR